MRRALLILLLLSSAVCRAQDDGVESREGIALQNQMLELRQQVEQLQGQVSSGRSAGGYVAPPAAADGGGASGDLTAQLLGRVQTLEDQVRTLRGQVEELQNQVQRDQQDIAKQVGDLSFQLQQGGSHAGEASATPSQPTKSMSPPPGNLAAQPRGAGGVPMPATPRRTPEIALQEATAALGRHDYPAAEAAAREALGSGRHGAEAEYLLGQAKGGQHDFQDAAVAFDDSYNRSHGGGRAQDSLLGLASSLYNLGDKGATCGALNKLHGAFPAARADIRDGASALRARAGCGG